MAWYGLKSRHSCSAHLRMAGVSSHARTQVLLVREGDANANAAVLLSKRGAIEIRGRWLRKLVYLTLCVLKVFA